MSTHSSGSQDHRIGCIYCHGPFDLFGADWCTHRHSPHLSKVCPHCRRCLCDHPMYREKDLWKEAPAAFQRHGFRKMFVLYM
jgi:hypothetical protein